MFSKILTLLMLYFFNKIEFVESDTNLLGNAIPHFYSIQFNPYSYNGVNSTFIGNSTINFQLLQPLNYVIIHKGRHILMEEHYTRVISATTGHDYNVTGQWWYPLNDHYVIEVDQELEIGNYSLMLRWTNDYTHNKKIFRVLTHDVPSNSSYFFIGTKNLRLSSARNLFPCWDEPIFRSIFEISIEHPKNFTALSNMPIERNFSTTENNYLTYFKKSPSLSPHSISFAITNYPVISTPLKTMALYSIRQDQTFFMNYMISLSSFLHMLKNYTAISYPLPKIDSVIISGNEDGCLSNPGLIYYRSHGFESSKPTSPLILYRNQEFRELKTVTAILFQWFTDLITPKYPNYSWLYTGICHNLAAKIHNEIYPRLRRKEIQTLELYDYMLDPEFKKPSTIASLSIGNQQYASQSVKQYVRGTSIIQMLEYVILKSENYQTGLKRYLNNNLFNTTTLDDLWNSLQNPYIDIKMPLNIKATVHCWIKQPGFPIINVTRNYDTGIIKITRISSKTSVSCNWIIPLTFLIQSSPLLKDRSAILMSDNEKSLFMSNLDSDKWLILNINQMGYYRVFYDDKNWDLIIKYLNSQDYHKIPPINRAVIITEISELYYNNNGYLDKLLRLLWYLKQEKDILPLMKAIKPLNTISKLENINKVALSYYLSKILSPILERINHEYDQEEYFYYTASLRLHFLRLYCPIYHNDEKCYTIAKDILKRVHENPKEEQYFDKYFYSWTLCTAMRDFDETKMIYFFSPEYPFLKNNNSDKYMYLHCVKNQTIVEQYFNKIMKNNTITSSEQFLKFIDSIMSDDKFTGKIEFILDYLIDNYSELYKKLTDSERMIPKLIFRLNEFIVGIKQWEKFKSFLLDRASELKVRYSIFQDDIIQNFMNRQSKNLARNIQYKQLLDAIMSE